MKKRLLYRGYHLENASGDLDDWKVTINGKILAGKVTLVKKSIDWWCDMKTIMSPASFAQQETAQRNTQQKSEDYKGFKLMNDSGKPNEWYVLLRGQLLKGSPAAIKKHLDMVLAKLAAQQKK
ncbi:DUF3319 domain-containing protein [Photobacterium swingsii]|uniref:DUF3319 domain-containing protein n=1 Tax=Photobacterium swingsii TaxID=680026 RepID=A0A0J8VGF9_9GAMM|nr:DUF3319 domain-containing protein [Photobacterium swingsii]KMV31580.1 hypothetical protein AB733_05700 [Photobacterium swingsii]PSW24876.1 DUF3319 domain-containing protein [Photobacterium swingsii]